jgi:hypothetical protein
MLEITDTLKARFWNNVQKTDECWLWTGRISVYGAAILKMKMKTYFAHRISYELASGPIPQGYYVHHTCDTKHCVNPSHLYINDSLEGQHKYKNRKEYQRKTSPEIQSLDSISLFWARVNKTDTCWIWTGNKDEWGYGKISIRADLQKQFLLSSKAQRTHRMSYMITYGPIPDGLNVCHNCDNPSCVNPEHLFLGTTADNHRDMINKGRQAKGRPKKFRKLPLQDELIKLRQSGLSSKDIAEIYDVTSISVNSAIRYKYKH